MADNDDHRPTGELLIYQVADAQGSLQVRLEGESVWLSQRSIAELYGVEVQTVNEHIANIYADKELETERTIRKFRIVQTEGSRQVNRYVDHFNLELILAVGFRVRSRRGSQFRQWAIDRLREYLVKGFTMDDERLKGKAGVVDYFDELLERIRDIRASEARVYLMVRNIFALAADYDESDRETQHFFATMQNKMHYAATGLTAAEIIKQRADATQPNMGLTNWKGSRVKKGDTATAKNYLDADEIDTLNRITVMFLDQAEFRAQRRQAIRMEDWTMYLDKFLNDVELPVLQTSGTTSRLLAMDHAHQEYGKFADRRRLHEEESAEQEYAEELRRTAKTLARSRAE